MSFKKKSKQGKGGGFEKAFENAKKFGSNGEKGEKGDRLPKKKLKLKGRTPEEF